MPGVSVHGVSGGRLRLGGPRARNIRRVRAQIRRSSGGARHADSRSRVVVRVAPGRVERRRRARGGDARASRFVRRRTRSRAGDRARCDAVAFDRDGRGAARGGSGPSAPVSASTSAAARHRVSEKTHAQTARVSRQLQGGTGPHERRRSARALAFPRSSAQLRVNAFVTPKIRGREGDGALWSASCATTQGAVRAHARSSRSRPADSAALGARRAGRRARRRQEVVAEQVLRRRGAGRRAVLHLGGLFEASGHSGNSPERTSLKKKTEEENALEKNAPDETTRGARARHRGGGFFLVNGFPVSG